MASNTLFPPVVNNVEPAFVTVPLDTVSPRAWQGDPGELKVYFKFSALNSDLDINQISVQATIHIKEGSSIVNLVNGSNTGTVDVNHNRLRATQIILNLKPVKVNENSDLWYITLLNEDVMDESLPSETPRYYGWLPGRIYKIQLRLSDVACPNESAPEIPIDQQKWLYDNADHFSEWSEIIYSKCISNMVINSNSEYEFIKGRWNEVNSISYPQIFQGTIKCVDNRSKEHYASALLRIYKSNDLQQKLELIEDKTIYPNETSYDNYNYTIKYNFIEGEYYLAEFSFITDNQYQSDILNCWFIITENLTNICDYKITTIDDFNQPLVEKIKDGNKYYTSLGKENDNGCIGLKIEYDPPIGHEFSYAHINLRIVRTDENSNFTIWEEIKYINLKLFDSEPTEQQLIEALEKLPIIFDYTIESNTFYKYGIQSFFNVNGVWYLTHIKEIPAPIQRDFDYSFLLGKDQRQLKIKFNDNISSFTSQIYDSKLEPVGSKYPYISRNSTINYKTFPISGTISFEMDDNETFLPNGSLDIYNYEQVDSLHKSDFIYGKYNYGYERRFRQKVLEFLQNGEIKLFKSTTEGNILVRLRDINCTPNQQLSRLIYNFAGTADEVGGNDLDSIKQSGILYPGTYVTDWSDIDYIPIPADATKDIDPPHTHNLGTTVTTPVIPMRITL